MKSRRKQRNRELMVQEILDTARTIMREEGAAALSLHELARRLDLRTPSLYNYFASKGDLYDALFRLGFGMYDAYMQERVAGTDSWQEEIRRYLSGYMAFALENPELYQLCFERPVPGFVPSPESLKLSQQILQRGYDGVGRWREHMNSTLSNRQIADLVIAMMHGLTALHMANEPGLPVGEGRFGGLIAAAVALFDAAWSTPVTSQGEKP